MAQKVRFGVINYDAREKMNLSLAEYCLLDIVYHLSNNPASKIPGWCYASKKFMASRIGLTERGIFKLIDRLIELEFLERDQTTGNLKVTIGWYRRTIVEEDELSSVTMNKVHTEQSSVSMNSVPQDHELSSVEDHEQSSDNKNKHLDNNKILATSPIPENLALILPKLTRVKFKDPGHLYNTWTMAYPDVDIVKEILACEAWATSNKVTRSEKGWARTLNTWLKREQDRPKGAYSGKSNNHGIRRESEKYSSLS